MANPHLYPIKFIPRIERVGDIKITTENDEQGKVKYKFTQEYRYLTNNIQVSLPPYKVVQPEDFDRYRLEARLRYLQSLGVRFNNKISGNM